jgi:16S rRNA (cytidine1402-2'-O)-methyltransferase
MDAEYRPSAGTTPHWSRTPVSKQSDRASLFVVATPLGNSQDLSPRARACMSQVSILYCEDTRTTRQLLERLSMGVQSMRSLHAHNEEARIQEIIDQIESGNSVAIVSDAGTPCISDPGSSVIAAVHKAGLPVCPIPGPSAPIALLSAAGLPGSRHRFLGFLPKARGARIKVIAQEFRPGEALVCFIPCRDLVSFLTDVKELLPEVDVVLGRELTKTYEEIIRSDIDTLLQDLSNRDSIKGEATVAFWAPAKVEEQESLELQNKILESARILLDGGLSRKDAQKSIALLTGISKRRALELVLQVSEQD